MELKESERKLQYYKREIGVMKNQLDGSYNIATILALEDDQTNKLRMLKQLESESDNLLHISNDQNKAMHELKKSGNYEKKFNELNIELKQAKDHYKKLQLKQRDDEK